jgi:hypothetical protein
VEGLCYCNCSNHVRNFWGTSVQISTYSTTTDQIFRVPNILEKMWEYNGPVHQLCIDFEMACDSVRREVQYMLLVEFGTPMKLIRTAQIKTNLLIFLCRMVSNKMLHCCVFKFALEYAIRKIQKSPK